MIPRGSGIGWQIVRNRMARYNHQRPGEPPQMPMPRDQLAQQVGDGGEAGERHG